MNRYPWWKYAMLGIALVFGLLYTVPNFFGESPAVQVSAGKTTTRIDPDMVARVKQVLTQAGIASDLVEMEGSTVKARFADTDVQLKAKDAIDHALNPDPTDPGFVVALNLMPRTPTWMMSLNALPMARGLDLRGGVHFLLQVDMQAVLVKHAQNYLADARTLLRDKSIRHAGIERNGDTVVVHFRDPALRQQAETLLSEQLTDMAWAVPAEPQANAAADASDLLLVGTFKPESATTLQQAALKQNITTLSNRVNELGVAEPVIQQQGSDRVVVELPGIQDTAKAKNTIGRTATLEMRLVDTSPEATAAAHGLGPVPPQDEMFPYIDPARGSVVVKRDVVVTGDNLSDAKANLDQQTNQPIIRIWLDANGARTMRDVSRENIGKPLAVLLFEKNKGQCVTAPNIRSELGSTFEITGLPTEEEANEQALLLRAGSLAAPMEFVEERTIGPSLGAENIAKGFDSVLYGFVAITVFMCAYYLMFGVFSVLSLGFNLLLLVAVLSGLQATLSLPGIAAIALTLGMAIDANVLINERVREELRNGSAPQTAIAAGYERAWDTILDSNVTTLIAGGMLWIFGSGPVRGFATVHCLGILTSIFSSVVFSRGLVNFWYGRQKKLKSVAIGQVWKGGGADAAPARPAAPKA